MCEGEINRTGLRDAETGESVHVDAKTADIVVTASCILSKTMVSVACASTGEEASASPGMPLLDCEDVLVSQAEAMLCAAPSSMT